MTREPASRGDGGEGTGAVPPPRSLQQLPLLLSSRRSRSAASGRAEQPGVGERCGELSGSDRDCGGGGADTPPSRARPPGAPPAPRAPGSRTPGARPRDRSFFASGRAHRKWRRRKPPGRRELFCAGVGWWPVARLVLEGQSRGSGGTWKPLAWKNYESFLRVASDALEPSRGHGAGARPAPVSGWRGFRTQRLLTQGRFFWVVGGTYTCPLWVLRPLLILRSVSARKACSPLPAATAAPSLHSYRYFPNIQVHHVLLDRLSLPEFMLRDTTDFLRGNVINFTQVLLCASSQLPTSCADFKINAFSIVCCAFMHLKSTWIFCELIR